MTLGGLSRIYGGISQLTAATKVVIPWWLSGGIAAVNCIGAYAAKGAANLADSYINRANPGTYNLTVVAGKTAPGWDAVNGWNFNGTFNTNTLNTGITLNSLNWSVLAKFSGAGGMMRNLVYSVTGSNTFTFWLHTGNVWIGYYNCTAAGKILTGKASNISGVMGMAGIHGYWNGAEETEHITQTAYPTETIKIGFVAEYIQSVSFYDTPITPAQVAAVTNAMNAL